MSLRAAKAKLEALAKAHTANTDTAEMYQALAEMADGLFREFEHLHDRLTRQDDALTRIEKRLDLAQASDQ